jgi:hypothetical protein
MVIKALPSHILIKRNLEILTDMFTKGNISFHVYYVNTP